MGARLALVFALALAADPASAAAPKPPTRLFAADQPISVRIRGPVSAVASTPMPSRSARPAVLELVSPAAEQHAILLSPRGLTRRKRETCTFPPLRVEFNPRPAPTSLFERQRRLKLVTHCRSSSGHRNHVLLEYAAYRMFNLLSPAGLRVRLGTFDYVEQNGRTIASRLGFFIEDPDDSASRNGLREVRVSGAVAPSRLDPAAAARAAMFEYMIGNIDWSMRAGPPGDSCCHNFKLMGAAPNAANGIVPVPYDFDSSGLVDAPYAVPNEELRMSSVRERRYRGYCMHNGHALAAAAEFRARRGELLGVLAAIPGLDAGRRRSASNYLEGFFRDIANDEDVRKRVLRTCIN